jgi:hypothetical protein
VDSGPYQRADCAHRRRLFGSICRRRPETLDIGRSKQGAAPRQTISDGRLAPVIFAAGDDRTNEVMAMQTFFFDMKDGVPLRDRIGVEFDTNVEAIEHSRVLARHFRDESLRNDQDLEISVVNALGREIHREFVHREAGGK